MSVVNVYESWSGLDADEQQDGSVGSAAWGATREFTVLVDDISDDPQVALAADDLPKNGDAHNKKLWMYAIRRRAIPVGPLLYKVEVEYAGKDSPQTEAPKIAWRFVHSTEPIDRDKDDKPIDNPLGIVYEGITRVFSDAQLTYIRNEASYSVATMIAYQNAVNTDEFWGAAAGKVRVISISSSRVIEGTGYYWPTTYVLQFRADGWGKRVKCMGTHYYIPLDGKNYVMPAKDAEGQPTGQKINLNLDGTLNTDDAVWQTFDVYPEAALSGLGLRQ